MANVNVTFTATLIDGAGSLVLSNTVTARRVDASPLQAATLNTADTISGTSDGTTGIISLTLIGHSVFPVTYKISMPDGQYLYLRLPANAKSIGFGFIQVSSSPAKSVKNISSQFSRPYVIGQDIASATALPAPTCDTHNVSGTTTITSVIGTNYPVGARLLLVFAGVLTFTDGSNLKLAGSYTTSAGDSIMLFWDGTNWNEICRSGDV